MQWTDPPEPVPGADPGDPRPPDPELAGSRVLAVNFRNNGVSDTAPCLQTKSNSLNSNPSVLIVAGGGSVLRRLTPKECLRLQGFDDDWFDGPELNRKPLGEPDRFRLAGNSWTVPVAAWILSGLLVLFRGPAAVTAWPGWRRRIPVVLPARAIDGAVPAGGDHGVRRFPAVGGSRVSGEIATMLREAADRYREAA